MQYGTVTGQFLAAIGDTNVDPDRNPDPVPLAGKVTFAAELPKGRALQVVGQLATILPVPIECKLDAQGYLTQNNARGVNLIATDTDDTNPKDFTYKVTFSGLTYAGTPVSYGPFSIKVPAGQSVDLSVVAPVTSSNGVPIIRGEKGDPGAAGRDAESALVNDTHAGALRWTEAHARAQAGAAHAKVLVVGDSKSWGYPDGKGRSWPTLMQPRAAFGCPVQPGALIVGGGAFDPEWSLGSWQPVFGPGSAAVYGDPGAGDPAVCKPSAVANTIDVWWYKSAGKGTFVVELDGVAQPAIVTHSPDGSYGWRKTTYAVARGLHVVTLRRPSTGPVSAFVDAYDDAVKSVRVANWGVVGSRADTWADGPYSREAIEGWAPDLTLVMLGTNDANAGRTAADWATSIGKIIDSAKLSGDVVLLSCVQSQTESIATLEAAYRDVSQALAASKGVFYVDVFEQFGPYDPNQFMDNLHPNAVGHSNIGRIIGAALRAL